MPRYGFSRTVAMLVDACDKGIEAVEDAPAELAALSREMEQKPGWPDMELVEEDRKGGVEGKSVSVRVDFGGRHILSKKYLIKKRSIARKTHTGNQRTL